MTIDKLKKEYDQALQDLEKVVEEWNKEWKKTCQVTENKLFSLIFMLISLLEL